jgi:tetratricopeptide (TPR) repeat protein
MASPQGQGPFVAVSTLLPRRTLLPEEVAAVIRRDPTITEAVRQQALAWVEPCWRIRIHAETARNAMALNEANDGALRGTLDEVVLNRSAGASAYRTALRQAEAVCAVLPGNVRCRNILGIAYYRVGEYQKAVDTLEQCDKRRKESDPQDLAFLAMAQHQLGWKEQAQTTLARLREVMKQPRWARLAFAHDFLREAEDVLGTKPANAAEKRGDPNRGDK